MPEPPPPFDVIVIGSGPAGVSAAWPLVESGLRVLMVDGGETPGTRVPDAEYLATRAQDTRQWEWMIGRNLHALREAAAISPKFRTPTLDYVFRDFARLNRIEAQDFVVTGSLAVGGLSNAWGCGVTRFSPEDLAAFPFAPTELAPSFEAVARRIGVSGRCDDDLTAFFGVDDWAQAPIALDALHERLLRRYASRREALVAAGFRLGRARVAVLSEAGTDGRAPCDRQGFCLWGCAREALYSARYDVRRLVREPRFAHRPGFVVERLERDGEGWRVCGRDHHSGASASLAGRRVVMAAGTLATTAIVMRSLPGFAQTRLLSPPMAAFALWLPTFLGTPRARASGAAQLAFCLEGGASGAICGYTFSTHGLPVVDFMRHAPLARSHARALFRALLSSMVVANCFFPAALSDHRMELGADGSVRILGGAKEALAGEMAWAQQRLAAAFRRAGAFLLPATFKPGATGGDVHYAGSIPMSRSPRVGETAASGEVHGLPGVHVADAAAFPTLPAKSHTLALMACADRVGRLLASSLATSTH